MGWIIAAVIVVALVFLWMIVHSAARSVDDNTKTRQDEEQTQAVEDILRKREMDR